MADRSFWPVALVGTGSAAVAAVAAAQSWAEVPSATEAAKGSDVAPLALALALVALAAWGALLVSRGLVRRLVAVVGLVASLGTVAVVLTSRSKAVEEAELLMTGIREGDAGTTGWFYAGAAAATVAALTFVLAVLKASRWPEMGTKYDAPGAVEPEQADLWKAMDEGRDPTL